MTTQIEQWIKEARTMYNDMDPGAPRALLHRALAIIKAAMEWCTWAKTHGGVVSTVEFENILRGEGPGRANSGAGVMKSTVKIRRLCT
jgi:hypothetical protein